MTHFVNKKDVRTKKLFVLFTFLANFHLNSLFSQFNNRKTVPIKFRSSRVKHDEGGQCDQMGRQLFNIWTLTAIAQYHKKLAKVGSNYA